MRPERMTVVLDTASGVTSNSEELVTKMTSASPGVSLVRPSQGSAWVRLGRSGRLRSRPCLFFLRWWRPGGEFASSYPSLCYEGRGISSSWTGHTPGGAECGRHGDAEAACFGVAGPWWGRIRWDRLDWDGGLKHGRPGWFSAVLRRPSRA